MDTVLVDCKSVSSAQLEKPGARQRVEALAAEMLDRERFDDQAGITVLLRS
ncbi:MAG TPA: hypothetical protein VE592_02675 [Geminicoccaceae bacterium]|jgi:hypothetical protein|nr:hypothetical protein [Geminicoccaceae bacterium]HZA65821.1 hypothetical protein [Geminicoccaceae bacterium]